MAHRDDYLHWDINEPERPEADTPSDDPEPSCPECGAPPDEAHRKGCPEYAMTEDEYEAEVERSWRRYTGREPGYLRYGWGGRR